MSTSGSEGRLDEIAQALHGATATAHRLMCSARLFGEIVQQGEAAWFEHALTAHNGSASTQPANKVSAVQD